MCTTSTRFVVDENVRHLSLIPGSEKTENNKETILFDFFVEFRFTTIDYQKIQEAVAKSIDVCNEQVTIEKCEDVSPNKGRLRIRGLVNTNSCETQSLSRKFSRLIREHILSGTMQITLGLEDRPRISRFYVRCSNPNILSPTNAVMVLPFDFTKQIIDNVEENINDNAENSKKCLQDVNNNNNKNDYSDNKSDNKNCHIQLLDESMVHCGICAIM